MKKILITTDFSSLATHACLYGLQFAASIGAKVQLVHVYRAGSNHPTTRPDELTKALQNEDEEQSQKLFETYADGLIHKAKVHVPLVAILQKGNQVGEEIVAYADFMQADLIVMGMQGYSRQFANLNRLIGNTTTQVINLSKHSVLAVPKNAQFSPISHIVYATNFEEKAQRVPTEIKELLDHIVGKLSCIHIRKDPDAWISELQFNVLNEIYALEMDNFNINFYTIPHKHIRVGLNKFVTDYSGDVLAILTHRRLSVFQQLFDLSLTREMAFHSHVPLWVIHQ